MSSICMYACLLLVPLLAAVAQGQSPSRFNSFLLKNVDVSGLPLSYRIPSGYFDTIPADLKPAQHTQSQVVPQCDNQDISAQLLNAYAFQTERLLSTSGINLYDAALWSVALTLNNTGELVQLYQSNVLVAHRTINLQNIKGASPCNGIIEEKTCTDTEADGSCGQCYGPQSRTLDVNNAFFFQLISDYYTFAGEQDARCPTIGWTWNDYSPIAGANVWASLLGPLQVAFINANGDLSRIDANSDAMKLAANFIGGLQAMQANGSAILYAPYNTYNFYVPNIGSTAWVQDNAAIYAGLRALITALPASSSLKTTASSIADGVSKYLLSAYDPAQGYFRQGSTFNRSSSALTWGSGWPSFSVDAQSFAVAALSPAFIDSRFGANTTYKIWQTTKTLGGYQYDDATKRTKGLGFSNNAASGVLSSETSLAAINMLKYLTSFYKDATMLASLQQDITDLRAAVANLTVTTSFANTTTTAVLYVNRRYNVPFGYWANPVPSLVSTAWASLVENNFDPFVLGGGKILPITSGGGTVTGPVTGGSTTGNGTRPSHATQNKAPILAYIAMVALVLCVVL